MHLTDRAQSNSRPGAFAERISVIEGGLVYGSVPVLEGGLELGCRVNPSVGDCCRFGLAPFWAVGARSWAGPLDVFGSRGLCLRMFSSRGVISGSLWVNWLPRS